jgi:hypothetical protein
MNESRFWGCLEMRVSREFAGLASAELRHSWCDGFIPEVFKIKPSGTGVVGTIWIGLGERHQERWNFSLLVSRGQVAREDVDWAGLLPPENMTGWLSAYVKHKFLKINPFAAYPDRGSITS